MAAENPTVAFVPIAPGWVASDMGKRGNRSPPLQPAESVRLMLLVLSRFNEDVDLAARLSSSLPKGTPDISSVSGNRFLSYDGSQIAW